MTGEIFKIVAVVLIAALVSLLLKKYCAEYSFLLSLAVCALVGIVLFSNIAPQIQRLKGLFGKSLGELGFFSVALKALGIAYISVFAADICRDFGQTSLGAVAETAGKCVIFVMCIPLVCYILETVIKFAKI